MRRHKSGGRRPISGAVVGAAQRQRDEDGFPSAMASALSPRVSGGISEYTSVGIPVGDSVFSRCRGSDNRLHTTAELLNI